MKILHIVVFIVACLFKSPSFCLTNQPVDESQYFKCSIVSKLKDKQKIPHRIFLVIQHPKEKDRFRYMTSDEYQDFFDTANSINEKAKMTSWYNIKTRIELGNKFMNHARKAHTLYFFDDKIPLVLQNDSASQTATQKIASQLFLEKIDQSQKELNKIIEKPL